MLSLSQLPVESSSFTSMIVVAVLWALGLLFIFITQHLAIKKADRDWHINAATFKKLRRKINNDAARL